MNKEKEVEAYLRGELPEEEKIKYEIAEEMGILDKVLELFRAVLFCVILKGNYNGITTGRGG